MPNSYASDQLSEKRDGAHGNGKSELEYPTVCQLGPSLCLLDIAIPTVPSVLLVIGIQYPHVFIIASLLKTYAKTLNKRRMGDKKWHATCFAFSLSMI